MSILQRPEDKCYISIDIDDYDKYEIDVDMVTLVEKYKEGNLIVSIALHSSKKYPTYLFYSKLSSDKNNKIVSSIHKYANYTYVEKDPKYTVNKFIDYVNDNTEIKLDMYFIIIAPKECIKIVTKKIKKKKNIK